MIGYSFPYQFSFHRLLHTHHLSPEAGTIGQNSGRRTKLTQSHPARRKLTKEKSDIGVRDTGTCPYTRVTDLEMWSINESSARDDISIRGQIAAEREG
jgi:hypothetical protein